MKTDFYILNATTVPENYSWDIGIPLETEVTTSVANTTTLYASGYAPALRVYFYNNSESDTISYPTVMYNWNFGDYYNSISNFVSLTCVSVIDHLYIMPGRYTVTLNHIQTTEGTNLNPAITNLLCLGKYDVNWYWDSLASGLENATTWDQTMRNPAASATPFRIKQWSDGILTQTGPCFQKYCKYWTWSDLDINGANPLNWSDTFTDAQFEKQWAFERNDTICTVEDATFLTTLDSIESSITKVVIDVKELPPVANMYCVTQPVTGVSPLTVKLTPRTSKCGSFPIDKIVWDFGDGSPLKTITRYASPTGSDVEQSGYFISDPLDVRNYDVIHTYKRTQNTYPVFYPSLTCYSSCTHTSDSCSITIGPISLPQAPTSIELTKIRNSSKVALYVFDIDNNIVFTTNAANQQISTPTIAVNMPQAPLRSSNETQATYYGNPAVSAYPPVYIPACGDLPSFVSDYFLATEDNTPEDDNLPTDDETGDGIPIETQTELTIIP